MDSAGQRYTFLSHKSTSELKNRQFSTVWRGLRIDTSGWSVNCSALSRGV